MTWTGILNSRRVALGVKVNGAHAPGEMKIMTSSDGGNFEEAKCWQPVGRKGAAFAEPSMFDAPRGVKAVAIAMRGSQSWGYFGITSAALITEPGPFMLVKCEANLRNCSSHLMCSLAMLAAASHPLRENNVLFRPILVSASCDPCLIAIAAGDGREVMLMDKDTRARTRAVRTPVPTQ